MKKKSKKNFASFTNHEKLTSLSSQSCLKVKGGDPSGGTGGGAIVVVVWPV